MTVVTRFAPSPTGVLHIGSVRTALFNWLYAKKMGGKFILRIEDTDRLRSQESYTQAIFESLQWLGLSPDASFKQSERSDLYAKKAKTLLEQGKAYPCFCSQERLQALRELQLSKKEKPKYDGYCRNLNAAPNSPFVIRLKTPQNGKVEFKDLIKGPISIANAELDDLILLRSDGNPTFNFTNVIDDIDMGVTCVARGDDHLDNTARQIHIYEALGATLPDFAHMPMILGEDGQRLSKRHGAVGIDEFLSQGILKEAIINYLTRLGWSHGDQEIFSLQELTEKFDLKNVSKSPSTFDYQKLFWYNAFYLKEMDNHEIANRLQPFLNKEGISVDDTSLFIDLITAYKERENNLADLAKALKIYYQDEIVIEDEKALALLTPQSKEPLFLLKDKLNKVNDWQPETIKLALQEALQECGIKMGALGMPLRVALTGGTGSPSLEKTLFWIGKKRSCLRIEKAFS